jgi:hypothetical protein
MILHLIFDDILKSEDTSSNHIGKAKKIPYESNRKHRKRNIG